MKVTSNSKKLLTLCYGIGVFALSVYLLYFYFKQNSYVLQEDCSYYMAIADSIIQSGKMLNISTIPASPVTTPQNGVVALHLILSLLGFAHEDRLIAIVFINYFLHTSAVYPLYKIARCAGLTQALPLASLLGLYIGAFNLYRFQLIPFNDGIFNSLSLWLVYYLLVAIDAVENKQSNSLRKIELLLPMALAAILVHFRLQTLFVVGAALLTLVLTKKYNRVMYAVGLLLVALVSLLLPYKWIDISGISATSGLWMSAYGVFSHDFLAKLLSKCVDWCGKEIPYVLFVDGGFPVNLIYCTFALALIAGLVSGIRQNRVTILFISLICFVSMAGLIAFILPLSRYASYLFPLFYLLILLPIRMRPIGYVFVTLVLTISLAKLRFAGNIPKPSHDQFWLHLYEKPISLDSDNALFFSDEPSSPYLILGVRSYVGELAWNQILNHQAIFLCGDENLRSKYLTRIQFLSDKANFTFKTRDFSPDYQDEEGNKLIQLYDFIPKKL